MLQWKLSLNYRSLCLYIHSQNTMYFQGSVKNLVRFRCILKIFFDFWLRVLLYFQGWYMSDTVVMIEREQLLLLQVGYFFWEREGCISCAYSNISILFWCLSSCTQELGSGVISPIQLEMKTHETNVLLKVGGR